MGADEEEEEEEEREMCSLDIRGEKYLGSKVRREGPRKRIAAPQIYPSRMGWDGMG